MPATGSTQDITTTASELGTGTGQRVGLIVRNPTGSGASIYIGGSGVTTGNAAFVLAAGDSPLIITTNGEIDGLAAVSWYARTSSGTASAVAVTQVEA